MVALIDFVLTHLPSPPTRLLEVGRGEGELARELAARGYEVVAIDPPSGNAITRTRTRSTVLRSALDERFDELRFEWTPYL